MMKPRIYLYLILATIAAISCKTGYPETGIEKIEETILLKKHREAIDECEKILIDANYKNNAALSQDTRNLVADYLRLCLLKTNNLNNKFYKYKGKIKEMDFPLPFSNDPASGYFKLECGIPLSSMEINIMLTAGYQSSSVFWNIFERNSIITNRERHYEAVKNFTQNNLRQSGIDRDRIIREWKQKNQAITPDTLVKIDIMDLPGSVFFLFQIYPNNKDVLESYTAMMLFYKNLSFLPEIVKRYSRLGYTRLPDYVQEAVMIFLQTVEVQNYYGFEIEKDIRNKYIAFGQAVNNTYRATETPERIEKNFGDTYGYYYFITE